MKNYWNTHLSKKLGIKTKNGRTKFSSTLTNSVEDQKGSEPLMSSSSAPSCGSSRGSAETKENEGTLLQHGLEAPGWHDQLVIGEGYYDSFCTINDDSELSTGPLMEFLNGCSLDLGWHGL